MRSISIAIVSLFLSLSVQAGEGTYNCHYEDIKNISSYQEGESVLSSRALSPAEKTKLQVAFDDTYDCNEGVDLIGSVKTPTGADYTATCWADSLGASDVSLPLNCVAE